MCGVAPRLPQGTPNPLSAHGSPPEWAPSVSAKHEIKTGLGCDLPSLGTPKPPPSEKAPGERGSAWPHAWVGVSVAPAKILLLPTGPGVLEGGTWGAHPPPTLPLLQRLCTM